MPDEPQALPPGALLRWSAGLYLVLAIAGALWLGSRDGAIRLSLFVASERWWQDVALGLVGAALLIGVWQLGVVVLPAARGLERAIAETLGPLTRAEVMALALLSGRMPPERARDRMGLYRRLVVDDLLREREVALARLRRQGLHTLDLPPGAITGAVLNRYLALRQAF